MIEGSIELAGHEIRVQDEQVMVFVPGGDGGSEPLDMSVIRKLASFVGLAFAHHEQMLRGKEGPYPYATLIENGFQVGVNG
jgi:hypothetical protein